MEPHGGSRVYESGFQKIIIVVLDHIKEADAESPAESAPVEVEVAAIATVPESEEVLTGTRLDKALYRYVEDTWGPDYKQLPGRERLLPHLRQKFPKCTVTDGHARAIRRKYAPHALKKGGAPLHRT